MAQILKLEQSERAATIVHRVTNDDDQVLVARLNLLEREAELAKAQRIVTVSDAWAGIAMTVAAIVLATVVALLAAASSSNDFSVDPAWSRILRIAAVGFFGFALLAALWASSKRDGVDDAAAASDAARVNLARVERTAELERIGRELDSSSNSETLWSFLRSRLGDR